MRLVLGDCMLAKGAPAEGRDQLLAIMADETNPLAPQARYRAGECSIALQDWAKAIELLLPFRDHGPLQNLPNLSDRAVLRLGHAYAGAGQWDQSRYSNEILLGRSPTASGSSKPVTVSAGHSKTKASGTPPMPSISSSRAKRRANQPPGRNCKWAAADWPSSALKKPRRT
jgi:hypothetical protein